MYLPYLHTKGKKTYFPFYLKGFSKYRGRDSNPHGALSPPDLKSGAYRQFRHPGKSVPAFLAIAKIPRRGIEPRLRE